MQEFNYHTHTYRCKHAIGEDEEYVLAAIRAGYKILGFSDHAPYKDYPSDYSHMDIEQFDEYVNSISILKEKYKDQIDIKIGLESEYFSNNHEERKMLRDKLDYMILGQHFTQPFDSRNHSYFSNNTPEQILLYADLVCEALDTGLFLYLCHPDVFMSHQTSFSKECEIVAHKIAKKCVELDIPVELNIHAIRKGKFNFDDRNEYYYPNKSFWKVLAQYPLKIILGVDAHDPKDLLDFESINKALEEVKDLNLNFITEPLI